MGINCWEYMQCERQPGGRFEEDLGSCPAATAQGFDGINSGTNAGRACWAVAGSMCAQKPTGTYTEKFIDCKTCDFYKLVRKEEQPNFITRRRMPILLAPR